MSVSMTLSRFHDALRQDAADIERRACECVLIRGNVLGEAMWYALQGGKMLRGFLVMEGARLHEVDKRRALDTALAIECMHAYSLVHDDLPCMDDDDVRRGRPTVHRKWDEATAVLTGDALQAFAFDLLSNTHIGAASMPLVKSLAKAAGRSGMVSGQMMDIAAETARTPLTLEEVETLQARKTGALLRWSATAGPVLADADSRALFRYGTALGLAFQIADDILDVEGDAGAVGKAVGKDAHRGKATFVSLLGLDGAKRRAASLVQDACDALSCYGDRAETLKQAAQFVIARDS